MANRDIFQAMADPTRREIIHILAKSPMNLNAIAEKFDISRPAISKHIKILSSCGVILITQRGRERHCEADLRTFESVSRWMEDCRRFWTGKLDALDLFLNDDSHSQAQLNGPDRISTSKKKKHQGKKKKKKQKNKKL